MDLNAVFTQIRDKLDAHYDRRERLIKISRDITASSKKMIFSLQRIQGDIESLPKGIARDVEFREKEIQGLLEKAKGDIQGADAYRYLTLYGANGDIIDKYPLGYRNMFDSIIGMLTKIEALTFRHYILHKSLPSQSELQESYFSVLPMSMEDYILGVADLTYSFQVTADKRGELMRRAINNISSRAGRTIAMEICTALRHIESSFLRLYIPSNSGPGGLAGELGKKISVMKTSVSKVESACYNVHVRGSERPEGWSVDFNDSSGGKRDRNASDEDDGGRGKRQRLD
jgi:predicted translin family RNA/ssDNA-binding protein